MQKEHQLNMTEYKQKYCLIIYILQMKLSMGYGDPSQSLRTTELISAKPYSFIYFIC